MGAHGFIVPCMPRSGRDIIVVGASAGGVQALQQLAAGLPGDLPAAVFVVLHTWPGSESLLPSILGRSGPLPVVEARHDAPIERGKIYVAPTDRHLLLEPEKISVLLGPRENRARPAINPLFRSAATIYRNRVIGVVLTGTLDDGAAGLWAIKQGGGIAIVQSDAAFTQMPRAAAENVTVDYDAPLAEIPALLDRLAREPVEAAPRAGLPKLVQVDDDAAKLKPNTIADMNFGQRSVFSCPECSGALWEVEEGVLQYRCHVGHVYSARALSQAQNLDIEQSLWSAIRALKESVALDERLAVRSDEHRLDKAAERYREFAATKTKQVAKLQAFLAALQLER
jgi:two-component system, chemotaxis family, protein-glutamate methylesterase/glutaminase